MALAICFVTMTKAKENINTIAKDFAVDSGNLDAIAQLNDQKAFLDSGIAFDAIILAAMVIDFVLHGCCMSRPIRSAQKKAEYGI